MGSFENVLGILTRGSCFGNAYRSADAMAVELRLLKVEEGRTGVFLWGSLEKELKGLQILETGELES